MKMLVTSVGFISGEEFEKALIDQLLLPFAVEMGGKIQSHFKGWNPCALKVVWPALANMSSWRQSIVIHADNTPEDVIHL